MEDCTTVNLRISPNLTEKMIEARVAVFENTGERKTKSQLAVDAIKRFLSDEGVDYGEV